MIVRRRDLILGGACVVAAGAAYQLKPRRKLNLLGARKMETVIPEAFGNWESHGDVNLVQPVAEGSLAARLYSQSLARIYTNTTTDESIMVLVAYGDNQSDMLQLHRPEACYPAVGFRVVMSQPAAVALAPSISLPVRRVVAEKADYREDIVYWTRLGEYLPTDSADQGRARLATAMKGYIADGALFRCSAVGNSDAVTFASLDRFIVELVRAVGPGDRPAILGTSLARSYKT